MSPRLLPRDIYACVVSSQFDADRLDYVQRDRLMTGTRHGGFDLSWILANLEVDRIPYAKDGEAFAEADGLVLSSKALEAAEAFVLGLFQLYFTVYFHKTTRAAERMLSALLRRVGELIKEDRLETTGLLHSHPLPAFLRDRTLKSYLALDDFALWTAIHSLAADTTSDEIVRELARGLLQRELYKSVDVQARLAQKGGEAAVAHFRAKLTEARQGGRLGPYDAIDDTPARSPYRRRGFDSPEALTKVLIRRQDGKGFQDLAERSQVVEALEQRKIYRVYVRNGAARTEIERLLGEVMK